MLMLYRRVMPPFRFASHLGDGAGAQDDLIHALHGRRQKPRGRDIRDKNVVVEHRHVRLLLQLVRALPQENPNGVIAGESETSTFFLPPWLQLHCSCNALRLCLPHGNTESQPKREESETSTDFLLRLLTVTRPCIAFNISAAHRKKISYTNSKHFPPKKRAFVYFERGLI